MGLAQESNFTTDAKVLPGMVTDRLSICDFYIIFPPHGVYELRLYISFWSLILSMKTLLTYNTRILSADV
jgi:hypothetical protein